MTIGLVLSEPPAYSETFFNTKINGLQENGFKVIVFTSKKTGKEYFFKHVPAYKIYSNSFIQLLWAAFVLPRLLIKAPVKTISFFRNERRAGTSVITSLKKLFLNAHILPYKLDWLHFGFATLSLNRERLAKAMNAKMAVSFRGYDVGIYPIKHPGCYKLLWQNVDKIHTISDDLVKRAIRHGLPPGVPRQKICPAVDVSLFPLKNSPGFINKSIKFLSVGRLHWKKGFEVALQALQILKWKGFEFNYNIIGEGEERERLIFAIHQLGLQNEVILNGKLSHREVVSHYSSADIYLQPSLQEGFCNSVLEAQLSGLLCIVSNAEGLAENVVNEKTGYVTPRYSSEALSEAIEKMINLPENTRREMALNANDRVKQFFCSKKQKEEFRRFYQN